MISLRYYTKKIVDKLTGEVEDDSYLTNTVIQTFESTSASSNPTAAITISVPPTAELVVWRIMTFANDNTSYWTLSYSYTSNGQTFASALNFGESTLGNQIIEGSMQKPIMAMMNYSNSSQNVVLNLNNPTSGNLYIANVFYVLKNLETPTVIG